MFELREAQAAVMDALTWRSDGAAAAALLRPGTASSAQRQLQIYRNNFFETRIGALNAVYPVVARLVGTEFFRCAASVYSMLYASRSGDLREFGEQLPDFLREYRPAASLPYLDDVAGLEWAYHRAYHEVELPGLDVSRLAKMRAADQAQLRFHLQPSATVITSPFPVLRIWQANQPQEVENGSTISLDEGGVALLVVQNDLEVEFRLLTAAECRWLSRLASGDCLADASGAAFDCDPQFDLGATLARHLGQGVFVDLSLARRDQSVIFP